MKDDAESRLDSLFATARSVRPDTSAAEEFFETRLMSRIREKREAGQPWFSWVWRLAPVFTVVVVALGLFSMYMDENGSMDVYSALANDQAEYQITSYLGGE